MNRANAPRDFYLSLAGIHAAKVDVIGIGNVSLPVKLSVEADKVRMLRVLVTVAPRDLKSGAQDITFVIGDAAHKEAHDVAAVFVSGGP